MPTTDSADKRARTNRKKGEINKGRKSKMKTAINNFHEAVAEEDIELAKERLQEAKQVIDKVASKGTIPKNRAARKKSKLDRKFNQLD
ncbi:30S ribosomal protein S20 [Halanaerocella petrolearia]